MPKNMCSSCVAGPPEKFARGGAAVAIFTVFMRRLSFVLLFALPLHAQNWSASVSTGPFIFGHFAERTATLTNESGSVTTRSRLSAATRAGAAADVQRDFGRWLSLRLASTWTSAPLSIKSSSGGPGVSFDAGHLHVTTFTLPLVVHLNRGAFRFNVFGGPAYAGYSVHRRGGSGTEEPLFNGTRWRFGAAGGVGVEWWWTQRFAAEWEAVDIVTGSPLHVTDIAPTSKGVRLLRPQNGHTTIGVRYRF